MKETPSPAFVPVLLALATDHWGCPEAVKFGPVPASSSPQRLRTTLNPFEFPPTCTLALAEIGILKDKLRKMKVDTSLTLRYARKEVAGKRASQSACRHAIMREWNSNGDCRGVSSGPERVVLMRRPLQTHRLSFDCFLRVVGSLIALTACMDLYV